MIPLSYLIYRLLKILIDLVQLLFNSLVAQKNLLSNLELCQSYRVLWRQKGRKCLILTLETQAAQKIISAHDPQQYYSLLLLITETVAIVKYT